MIYTNTALRAESRVFDFGTIYQCHFGEFGRGRKAIVLTCPESFSLEKGEQTDKYTVSMTKSGKPRIVEGDDGIVYLALSSERGYTRRGNGRIWISASQKNGVTAIAEGNGADGDAGRIGQWRVILFKVEINDAIFKVSYAGGEGIDYFIVHDKKVYKVPEDLYEEACENLGIEHIPDNTGSYEEHIKYNFLYV